MSLTSLLFWTLLGRAGQHLKRLSRLSRFFSCETDRGSGPGVHGSPHGFVAEAASEVLSQYFCSETLETDFSVMTATRTTGAQLGYARGMRPPGERVAVSTSDK